MSATSYESKGTEKPPDHVGEEFGSSKAAPLRELVPELTSRPQRLLTYDKMARTDAITSVSLRSAKVPVLGAEYYIDPVGEDQVSQDIAEFVNFNIFEGPVQDFTYTLGKILKMYQHGFSVVEAVYEYRVWAPKRSMANRKKYTMLHKLAYRPAQTIVNIETDNNGGPVNIKHQAIQADGKAIEKDIQIEKAIVFSFGEADDLFGDSILRSAYPHWYYKTYLYKIDAIQKERHGIGVPQGTLPPGFTKEDKDVMDEMLANLRTNEKAFIAMPYGWEVGFAKVEGQLVDVLKSASYHDVAIMLNVMAEFMMLGVGSDGGGRATSGAQLDLFYKASYFIANFICGCYNTYLIPKLVRWNFDTDTLPKMKVRNIGQSRDLQQISAALASLADKQLITPDMDLEQWTRTLIDAPAKKEPRPTETPTQGNGSGPIPRQGNMGKAPTDA